MEIVFLQKEGKQTEKCSFVLKGVEPAFANTLRRNIIDSVPTMAIEDVEISKNSSVLYDEIISHRLGLLPLTTDLSSYELPENCKCKGKGCARCTLVLTLSAKGPGTVYASAIKSKDSKVKPVFGETPIVKLLKGQNLELTATAILGIGKNHAKWSPGLVHYKNNPVIDITKNPENPEEVAKSCPVGVFEVKAGKLEIKKDNLVKCHLCEACVDASAGVVKLGDTGTEFLFTVEAWGQLGCKEMVLKAIEQFDNQLEDFAEEIGKLK